MLPDGFRTLRTLRNLNVIAVGSSLAALTGAAFASLNMGRDGWLVAISTLSTFVVGSLWAIAHRSRKRVTSLKLRAGWAYSPLFAMGNAALAGALLMSFGQSGPLLVRFFGGAILGATYGAVIWVPALILTLLFFAFPIARSQRLAEQGLAGEEDGERVVGITTPFFALFALAVLAMGRTTESSVAVGLAALTAMITGGTAAVRAHARAKRRRAFVKEAEEGKVEGYRVEPTAEGKVLIRVDAGGKDAYRSAERFEAVYELASDGDAKRALVNE